MWQIQAQIALDIARERTRAAQQEALANRAKRLRAAEARTHGLVPPSRARVVAARILRAVSSGLAGVAAAACRAAARVERRTA